MKVKCIIDEYFDRKLNKYIKKDEVLSVDNKRAEILIKKKFVKELEDDKKMQDVQK